MDLISLQLLHQQPYFTACGFFNIDMTLAYAVNSNYIHVDLLKLVIYVLYRSLVR